MARTAGGLIAETEARLEFMRAAKEKYPDLVLATRADGIEVFMSDDAKKDATDVVFVADPKGDVWAYAYVPFLDGVVYACNHFAGPKYAPVLMSNLKRALPDVYDQVTKMVAGVSGVS